MFSPFSSRAILQKAHFSRRRVPQPRIHSESAERDLPRTTLPQPAQSSLPWSDAVRDGAAR